MTEENFIGLMFLSVILLTLFFYAIYRYIGRFLKNKKIKQLKQADRRIKATQEYAEFVAISSCYGGF